MLMPKKVKFRKHQRGNNKGLAVRGSSISFGEFALKSVTRGLITSRQIESARKAISNKTKRGGKKIYYGTIDYIVKSKAA